MSSWSSPVLSDWYDAGAGERVSPLSFTGSETTKGGPSLSSASGPDVIAGDSSTGRYDRRAATASQIPLEGESPTMSPAPLECPVGARVKIDWSSTPEGPSV